MKNSKATVSNLTEQDIKELQNYLAAMNDLYEQEPKEIWDDFFKGAVGDAPLGFKGGRDFFRVFVQVFYLEASASPFSSGRLGVGTPCGSGSQMASSSTASTSRRRRR